MRPVLISPLSSRRTGINSKAHLIKNMCVRCMNRNNRLRNRPLCLYRILLESALDAHVCHVIDDFLGALGVQMFIANKC
jgi:hypothetical protein